MLAFQDLAEAANGFLQRQVFTFHAGELFRYTERLRQESLDLSGSVYDQLVGISQFVHT